MFGNIFGTKKEASSAREARWDDAYQIFVAVLVVMRSKKVLSDPNYFLQAVVSGLSGHNLTISEAKMDDMLAGYLDYYMQQSRYDDLLDLMYISKTMKNDKNYTIQFIELTKIFAKVMFGAQDFLSNFPSNDK